MAIEQSLLCTASAIGVVPAIAILALLLDRFDRYFGHTRLFAIFVVGMVLGIGAFVYHLFLDAAALETVVGGVLLFMIGFPLLETLMKTVVVNWRSLRATPEAGFGGIAVGAGFGATAVIGYSTIVLDGLTWGSGGAVGLALLVLALYAGGVVPLHAATGLLVGFGAAKRLSFAYTAQAMAVHTGFNILFIAVLVARGNPALASSAPGAPSYLLPALTAYGLGWLIYLDRTLSPRILPAPLERQRQRLLAEEAALKEGRVGNVGGGPPAPAPHSSRDSAPPAPPRKTTIAK